MSKKVGIGSLASEVQKIVEEYGDAALDVIREVAPDKAKAAKKQLKSASPGKTGKYAKGWSLQSQNTRLGVDVVIYNKNKPGLTHLLENGHALRNGGRSKAIPHIGDVNDTIKAEFIDEVTRRLETL